MTDMTEREQRIAEITMAHIYTWTDGKTETSHIKFGTAALRSAVNMIDDTVRITEFNQVLESLVENKYLKKIGRHMYGLGTGKGLKRYQVNDKSLLYKPSTTGFNNSKFKKQPDNQATAPVITGSRKKAETKSPGKQKPKNEKGIIASGVHQSSRTDTHQRLTMELDDISSRLTMPEKRIIQDKDTKLMLLENLANLLAPTEPLTADLLSQIKNDLQGEAA